MDYKHKLEKRICENMEIEIWKFVQQHHMKADVRILKTMKLKKNGVRSVEKYGEKIQVFKFYTGRYDELKISFKK
jgi:hypothetical protein